jgi:hypothetical protein
MNTDLDLAIKSAVSDIVAAAPEPIDDPTDVLITSLPTSSRRRLLPAAAAVLVVAAGVTGIALANRDGTSSNGPATAEQPGGAPLTEASSEPTSPPTTSVPATSAVPAASCGDGGGETVVPNVAGMTYNAAVDQLLATGLSFEAMREAPPEGGTATDDGYAIVGQDTAPGDTASCGAVVRITAAWRPGMLYTIEPGDTWESMSASQDIPVEDLLAFNGFTVAELEAAGETTATPLDIGRAISLSLRQPTHDTIPTTTD